VWCCAPVCQAAVVKGVSIAWGNNNAYMLDNPGDRLNQQVKDAAGSLVKKITRVYKAFKRLQASPGR
jgi:hypothetical protein